ncbi:ABC transporter substrate-binding protein [Saccharopolyspora sp. 5N708]|uniref:ABC transporter substrate-binding protein n=1 Tax=Saccharopolyspora sp. 5N708 TaxID=3457424 RepID=UPI003FD55794
MPNRWSFRAAVAGLAATLFAASACASAPVDTSQGTTLTLAAAVDVNSFAPADSRDAHYVQFYQPVYDSLLKISPQGEYQPMLATSWRYNADNTVLHLTLRQGVEFSDGQPFDGAAVKANLAATKKGTGTGATGFASIKDIVVNSPSDVDILLSRPDPGLVHQLAMPGGMMASPAAIEAGTLKTTPVGTGPYLLDPAQTTPTVQYTYVRNPHYWNPQAFPYDKLVLKPMTDTTARLNAVRSGQVDASFGDPLTAAVAREAGLTVTDTPGPGFQGLFIFDRAGKIVPALADVRVRQAMNYALDRDAIIGIMTGGAARKTAQPFNPQSGAADPALDNAYPYDPAKARQLLAEAGYPDGFTLPMPMPLYPNVAPILKQLLGAVGIEVDYVQVPVQATNSEYLSGKYAVVWYQLQSSEPWQAVNFWGSPKASWNPLKVDDPDIDAQIERVRQATGDARNTEYHKLSQLYVDKAWFAPAYFPDSVYFSAPKVEVTAQRLQIVPSIYNYRPAS